jgi:uncharacterized repeat protein (TIGR03833 family)
MSNSDRQQGIPPRKAIYPGVKVSIIEKQNQSSGKRTEGIVVRLLTKSPTHPHGIKVVLTDGKVGRVQEIVEDKK